MNFKLHKIIALCILFILTVFLYQKYRNLNFHHPEFSLESRTNQLTSPELKIYFESEIIPQPQYLPAAHSSSFTMLPNHDLLAFWFAGTKEGKPDVKVWHSLYHDNHWSMATPLVDPQMIAKANHRYVIKVGNPVVYRAVNGKLHLFVVSVSVGGWSGSALNHLVSNDDGVTWSSPERIVISPFFNISTLVRTSAITLTDGGFYLPVYHEFIRKYPELLHFDANGNFIEQIRITAKNRMLQPSVVPVTNKKAWAYFRNSALPGSSRQLFASYTENGGISWSKPAPTNLTNPDSSLEVENLNDGRLLMVYNEVDRSHLWLATSTDGLNWHKFYQLESTIGDEFSYPSLQVNGDDINILYTNNRRNIKHVRFNRLWLNKAVENAKY